jgi:hypothetical protein
MGPDWSKEVDRDVLRSADRIVQLVGVILTLVVISFLALHWTGDTGFYTSEFTEPEALILLVPLLYGALPNLIRVIVGRKNVVRPLDALGILFFLLSALYFLSNFHFDMTHFADPLPGVLRFLIDWIDEGWARILLVIGVLGGTFGLFWTLLTYIRVRELLMGRERSHL